MALDRLQRLLARDDSHGVDGWASAELHEFRGELFLVDGWARGSGDALRNPSDSQLGAAVLRRLQRGRTQIRPLVTTPSAERRDRSDWDRFCRRKAHCDPDAYEPERRLQLLWDAEGLRFSQGAPTPVEWRALDVDDEDAIGRSLRDALDQIAPRWPVVGRVLIAVVSDRYLMAPMNGVYLRPPIADLYLDVTVDEVGELALDVLRRSEVLPDDSAAGSFEDELVRLAVSAAQFEAATKWHLSRNDRGDVLLSDQATEAAVDEPTAVAVGTAIAASIGSPDGQRRDVPLFGPKTGWIAAEGVAPEQVTAALELVDVVEVSTADGLARSTDSGVFVLGPVDGWVLAVGTDLLLQPPDVELTSARLNAAVRYFASHRVVEGHQWTLAVDGRVVRSFRYLGETGEREERGSPTEVEVSLGVNTENFAAGEDEVYAIAASWSVDPTRIGVDDLPTKGRWGRRELVARDRVSDHRREQR